MPANADDQLIKLFESNFDSAKSMWIGGMIFDALSAMLSVAIVFTRGSDTTLLVGIIVFCLLYSFYLRISRKRTISLAEEIRTVHLVDNGLGNNVQLSDVEQYKQLSSNDALARFNARPDRNSPYYDVSDAPGPKRLLAMLHESAFFSWKISKRVILFYMGLLLIPLAIIFLSLVLVISFPQDQEYNSIYSQLLQISIAFLIGLGIIESILVFRKLFSDLSEFNIVIVDTRSKRSTSKDKAVILAWRYAMLQSHGEIIPNKLFKRHGADIQAEWNALDQDIRLQNP